MSRKPAVRPAGSSLIAPFSRPCSVLRRRVPETAAPTAPASHPCADLGRHKLTVRFLPRGENVVADFEIFQGDGLTLFGEGRLVIDHDGSFTLAALHLDLVAVDGNNFAAHARPATAGAHATAPTKSATTSAGTSLTAAAGPTTTGPTTTLEPLELFRRDAINHHRRHLLVTVGSATHHHVVTNFQIFQREILWLLLPLHPLPITCLIGHHHGLRGSIGLLDLESINSHGCDGSQYRRGATHSSPTRSLSTRPLPTWSLPPRALPRGRRILLRCHRAHKAQNQQHHNAQKEFFRHGSLPQLLTTQKLVGLPVTLRHC